MSRRKRSLRGLDEDIREHLEREIEDNIARGMAPEEARFAALRKFGNVTLLKEETRAVWSITWLEQLLQDVRFGLRMLWKSRELTVAAVLAIALGIGVNVGIFSVLNGIALRLLPVHGAEQVVSVSQIFHGHFTRNTHNETSMFSYSEYLEYKNQSHVFSGLVAYEPFVEATLGGGNAQEVLGTVASCNYFEILSEHPAQGRGFLDSDCTASGTTAVVVVSDDLWRSRFAADPSLIGRPIMLNRLPYTVIGIARTGFEGTEPIASSFWIPLTMQKAIEPGQDRLADENMSWLALVGRLKPGVSMEQVKADLAVIAARLDRMHSGRQTSLAVHVATFLGRPEERTALVPVSSTLLTAFGLILALACANVANLLLARATVRHREMALRQAIGAGKWRLLRQLLTESLLLSLIGGFLGSVLAFFCFPKLMQFFMAQLPRPFPSVSVNVFPDVRVVCYALLLTLLTGIVFGVVPALQTSRPDVNAALKEGGAYFDLGSRKRQLLRNTLIRAQIAFSMVLLLAAGLLLRGLYQAQTIDPGFETKRLVAVFLNLREQGYDVKRASALLQKVRASAAALPGVTEVAQAECAPLSHDFSADLFTLPGRTERFAIEYNHVSGPFFAALGVPIVAGRGFNADGQESRSIIVTESTAQRIWPGQNPLGKILRENTGREYSVIGVAKNAQVAHLGEPDPLYLYFPAAPEDNLRVYLLVRFQGRFQPIAKGLRKAVSSVDSDLPITVNRIEDYLDVWRAPSRVVAGLAGALGTLALLLASIGVYGMVSYSVNREVREIGIRIAVGANRVDIVRRILWRAMRPILAGALIGVAASMTVAQVLSSFLFGLSAHDPIAFAVVPLFLIAIAMGASLLPARRATRVDPLVALRFE